MGLRDKLDEMKKRAQRELAERAAKAAMDRSKEAAVSAFESAKKRLGDALFGEEEGAGRAPASPDGEQKAREDEAGRKLREGAARQAEREARAAKAAEDEKRIDDELAALKRKLGKPDGK